MRDGWIETSLGEIADVVGGGTPSTKIGEYWDGDIVWLTPTEITSQDGKVVSDSIRKITDLGFKNSGAQMLPINSVILTSRASVGFVALSDKELCTNQGFQSLIPKPSVLSKFIMFWIQQNRSEFESRSAGSTFKEISKSNVKSIKILLPPLPEQKRIVDLISSVDSYIEALQQQSERAKRSRNAVLHELLTAGGADWVETTLGNVCDFINGDRGKNYPSAKFRQSQGIPFINAGHLDKGIVNFDSMDFISEEVFEKLGSGKVQPGDTLFCLRGSVGKFANVEGLQKGAIASSLVIIRPKSGITKDFLMHYLDSEMCSSELKQSLTGAVQPNLSANNLKSFKISLPNIKSQIKIGELLGEFKVSITSLGVLIESTKNLRAGLLSDLLSGKHEIPASYDKVIGAA